MSLRLRLTLFSALLVGLVLLGAGAWLRLGLEQRLLARLDQELASALDLARPLVGRDPQDGQFRLRPDQSLEALPHLLPELTLLLVETQGTWDALGHLPPPSVLARLARPAAGYFNQDGYRLLGEPVEPGLYLLAALPLEAVTGPLASLDSLLQRLLPLSVLLALLLGYGLSAKGLAPADHLTRAALRLAEHRDWQARLPEPRSKDELWRLSRAVNHLLDALQRVIERERRFSQDASHALRTPLTILIGRLEQLPESPAVLEARRSAEELRTLVEKLLLLARAEAGGLRFEQLELDALAFEQAEAIRPLLEAKGLELVLELPSNPLYVRGDATALKAALQALLENALKFTPKGQVGVRVWAERGACLEVWDTGPGLGEAAESLLFERFYRGRHSLEGSGLGLALVAAVVRWHGGEVWARGRKGGARVGFRLPLD
ncbi:sensor histidine kinase [Meiothermus sp. QL-1]|uniref:sensor histidine kinase n=1 Tax=Meiothermus sp. QL-1 TaxID=2058095 RepID=UPI000E0C856A|nr:HAMP domain-containing sensor histidine kinase [Meiothermus sp. QL-1]RDI95122.1 sensor histidine kinase [Meiothermus sp. QL-1]